MKPSSIAALIAGAALVAAVPPTGHTGPRWASLGPDGGPVEWLAVDPTSPETVYAGFDGVICVDDEPCRRAYTTVDGGQSWSPVAHPRTRLFEVVVDPSLPDRLYAAGYDGVYRSTDGGSTWQRRGLGGYRINFVRIHPTVSSTLFAATFNQSFADARLYRSTDAGASWERITDDLDGWYIHHLAIDPVAPDTMYVYHDHELFKSTDGGVDWTFLRDLPQGVDVDIDPVTPTTVYASSSVEGVLRSTDGGVSWVGVNSGLGSGAHVLHVHPAQPSTIYATADDEEMYRSDDGGDSWSSLGTGPIQTGFRAVALDPVQPDVLYAGTEAGPFVSGDGGTSWIPILTGIRNTIVRSIALHPSTPGTAYAVATHVGVEHRFGGIVRTTDAGASWTPLGNAFPSFAEYVLRLDPTTPTTMYAAVAYHGVWKSTDAGASWTLSQSGLPGIGDDRQFRALTLDPTMPSTLFLGSYRHTGFVYRSTDAGATWATTMERNIHDLAFDAGSGILVAGASGGPYVSVDDGDTWVDIDTIHGYTAYSVAVDPTHPDTIYYGGQYDRVYRTTDGGATWDRHDAGLAGRRVTSLVIDPAPPGTVYAATWGGGVARSNDGGVTWTPINDGLPAARVSELAIDPTNRHVLWAATEGGGVARLDQATILADGFESGDASAWDDAFGLGMR